MPEHGRVPAEFTADRPEDHREQPEHGRAHQESGTHGAGQCRRLVARPAAPGDLQHLGEQFHEPFGGLPAGPSSTSPSSSTRRTSALRGGISAGVPRRIERAAASRTSAAAPGNSRARSRPGPSAGAPASGSASAETTGRMRSARPRGPWRTGGRVRAVMASRRPRPAPSSAAPGRTGRSGRAAAGGRSPPRRPARRSARPDAPPQRRIGNSRISTACATPPSARTPGVFQGSSDAGGQGDGHQHAADRGRCDDPSGRSEGPPGTGRGVCGRARASGSSRASTRASAPRLSAGRSGPPSEVAA